MGGRDNKDVVFGCQEVLEGIVISVTLPMASILEVAELVRHREACGRRGIQAAYDWPDRAVVPLKVETPHAGGLNLPLWASR